MKFNSLKSIKTNHMILLVLIGMILCKFMSYMSTEQFSQMDVSHGDISFYGRDSCPFCVKMKKELQTSPELYEKIEYIDITTEKGSVRFNDKNASGVPYFECKSTGKNTSGFQPVDKLLSNLGLQ